MPVDIAELRRLHEAATAGPWGVYSHQSGSAEGCYVSVKADAKGVLFDTLNAGSVRTIYSPEDSNSGWFEEGESADNLRLAAAARNALPSLLDRLEELERENVELKGAIERDRTTLADFVTRLKTEMDSRFWLTEGRGSYAWNDDRYRDEFRSAAVSILDAIKPLKKMAADLKNSPRDSESVRAARRDLEAALAAERQRVAELERENERLRIQVENLSPPSAAEEGLWNDLEADRERLDWLDGERGCVRGTDVAKWSVEAEDETVDSIREAIDAAREAAKG